MRGTPKDMQKGDLSYRSLRGDIIDFLEDKMEKAQIAGISAENVMVDPGIGFGKTQRRLNEAAKISIRVQGPGKTHRDGAFKEGLHRQNNWRRRRRSA